MAAVGHDETTFARRAAAIGRRPDELRAHGLAGTPAEVVDCLGVLAGEGVQRVYLQILDQRDLDHLDLVAREVATRL